VAGLGRVLISRVGGNEEVAVDSGNPTRGINVGSGSAAEGPPLQAAKNNKTNDIIKKIWKAFTGGIIVVLP
jgi:hypothetical protein